MRQPRGESAKLGDETDPAVEMRGALKVLAKRPGLRLLKLVAEGLSCWRSSVAVETEALAIGTSLEALGAPLEAFI